MTNSNFKEENGNTWIYLEKESSKHLSKPKSAFCHASCLQLWTIKKWENESLPLESKDVLNQYLMKLMNDQRNIIES